VLELETLTFYETKWKLRSSWAPKRMCIYECRCFLQVSSEIGAEQNPWNGRNGGSKVWVAKCERLA